MKLHQKKEILVGCEVQEDKKLTEEKEIIQERKRLVEMNMQEEKRNKKIWRCMMRGRCTKSGRSRGEKCMRRG